MPALRVAGWSIEIPVDSFTETGVGFRRFWNRMVRQSPTFTRSTKGRGRWSSRSLTLPGVRAPPLPDFETTS
jgi:hypothetical protein